MHYNIETYKYNKDNSIMQLEIVGVTLSAAKGLARRTKRSFAALRVTTRTPLTSAHGKPYLQMSRAWVGCLTFYDVSASM